MDTTLRDLERQVNSGDATPAQLYAAQCRVYGHKWFKCFSPRTILYLQVCERCFTSRGKHMDEVRLPEIFTATDDKGRTHAVKDVTFVSNFKGICGKNLSAGKFAPGSSEIVAACKQIIADCHKPTTCDHCLALLNRDTDARGGAAPYNHRIFAKRRAGQFYKTFYEPIANAML